MRRPVIAGNWKMYKTSAETRAFFDAFKPLSPPPSIATSSSRRPSPRWRPPSRPRSGTAIGIAAQNMHWEREGAFTGEISARMIVDAGCTAVIIGHSERRQYFGETDESVHRKTKAALEAGPHADRLRRRDARRARGQSHRGCAQAPV